MTSAASRDGGITRSTHTNETYLLSIATMESFLTQLTATIQDTVLQSIRAKLNEFADAVATTSDGKLTREQVLDCWNKINPAIPVTPATAAVEKKAAAPRAKTDKDRKCPVIKKSGTAAGQPCGKNCVVGHDLCSVHLKKETASTGPVGAVVPPASPAKPVAPPSEEKKAPAGPIPSDEELKKLTVPKLKELGLSHGVKLTGRPKKEDYLNALAKARDAPPASVIVTTTEPVAAELGAADTAQ